MPVGGRLDGNIERPRAVSEHLVERMTIAGADKICFVISAGKSDILEYYGGGQVNAASFIFVVQPQPAGLCDEIFHAAPVVAPSETVLIGLPDTIWFPENGLSALPDHELSFLLFPVEFRFMTLVMPLAVLVAGRSGVFIRCWCQSSHPIRR